MEEKLQETTKLATVGEIGWHPNGTRVRELLWR